MVILSSWGFKTRRSPWFPEIASGNDPESLRAFLEVTWAVVAPKQLTVEPKYQCISKDFTASHCCSFFSPQLLRDLNDEQELKK